MQVMQHISAPLRLFAGEGCLDTLERELSRLGCGRCVVLSGRSIANNRSFSRIVAALGDRFAGQSDGVATGSPRGTVERIAGTLKDLDADSVVTIGGGSAMVSARAAVILLAEGKTLTALCTRRNADGKMHSPRLDAPKLPIFAFPTTPTTAVVKPGSAVFDPATSSRLALFDPKTKPQAIFLDPGFLMSAPDELVRSAALNTLCSAIEGLGSASVDPVAQAMLMHAVRLTLAGLERPAESGPTMRTDMAAAAILCGRGTDNTGMGLATVISHAEASLYGIDGGVAKANALPHVLRFNKDHVTGGMDRLAQAMNSQDAADVAVAELFRKLGIPERLRDLGVPHDGLDEIARKCMGDWFIRSNPRPVRSVDEMRELLDAAW